MVKHRGRKALVIGSSPILTTNKTTMLIHTLPYNPILTVMAYDSTKEVLVLTYKRTNEKRSYNASIEIAYKLFYCKSAAECLNVFNTLIKRKCNLIKINK